MKIARSLAASFAQDEKDAEARNKAAERAAKRKARQHPICPTYEIIGADAEEGGWNLYTPRYGDNFVGNFPSFPLALTHACNQAGKGEVAVVDQTGDLPRITIMPKRRPETRRAADVIAETAAELRHSCTVNGRWPEGSESERDSYAELIELARMLRA